MGKYTRFDVSNEYGDSIEVQASGLLQAAILASRKVEGQFFMVESLDAHRRFFWCRDYKAAWEEIPASKFYDELPQS